MPSLKTRILCLGPDGQFSPDLHCGVCAHRGEMCICKHTFKLNEERTPDTDPPSHMPSSVWSVLILSALRKLRQEAGEVALGEHRTEVLATAPGCL